MDRLRYRPFILRLLLPSHQIDLFTLLEQENVYGWLLEETKVFQIDW